MFPLGTVIFPTQQVPLCVFEPRYHQLLEDVADTHFFGSCLIMRGHEVGGGDERADVATVVEVLGQTALASGQTLLLVEGRECVRIREWLPDAPYPRATVEQRCCDDVAIDASLLNSTESAVRALRALRSEYESDQPLSANLGLSDEPATRAWQLCALTEMSSFDKLKVLAISDPNERLRLVLEICCERYGDYQRLIATSGDAPLANFE